MPICSRLHEARPFIHEKVSTQSRCLLCMRTGLHGDAVIGNGILQGERPDTGLRARITNQSRNLLVFDVRARDSPMIAWRLGVQHIPTRSSVGAICGTSMDGTARRYHQRARAYKTWRRSMRWRDRGYFRGWGSGSMTSPQCFSVGSRRLTQWNCWNFSRNCHSRGDGCLRTCR